MKNKYVFLLIALHLCFFSQIVSAQQNDNINDAAEYGVHLSFDNSIKRNNSEWEGWGTSLCWWANRIGYNDKLTRQAADLFFNPETGLGLNIMRYNIGGGDDPTHNHITRTDSDVPGWMTWSQQAGTYLYNYNADKNQLNVLRAAVNAAGQDAYIEVFSNSPPYFMTNSGCSTGNFKAEENNLRDDSYTDFAEYLAHVTNYISKSMKLKVKSISPMNEPNTNYWPAHNYKQEGCHFDAGEPQSKLLVETSKALKSYGLNDVILTASDETNPGKQIEEIQTLSPEARRAIGRISAHTYGINGIRELGELASRENINLWMSEVDGNGTAGKNAGEMGAGLWLAEKIINDINAMEPSAWVLWQVIDTHVSKDGYKGRQDKGPLKLGGGYWGTAWADHDTEKINLSQKYYALGQFSRYIRPMATIIKCDTDRKSGCKAIAAWNIYTGELTIVCTNTTAEERIINFDLSELGIKRASSRQIRTSGSIADGEHWAETKGPKIIKSNLRASLLPNSITTYLVKIN
jgi:O-glycosyl hydrolase